MKIDATDGHWIEDRVEDDGDEFCDVMELKCGESEDVIYQSSSFELGDTPNEPERYTDYRTKTYAHWRLSHPTESDRKINYTC